ncbi:MAG: hypothetical protein R3B70_16190 [Polyangiaceae bacterium]
MKPASSSPAGAQDPSPPPPASETRPASGRVGAREALRFVREHQDPETRAALIEAGERYAGDADGSQEIEDIQSGQHPLQRGGRHPDAWKSFEAKLAAVRSRS